MGLQTYILDVMEGRRGGKGFLRALSYLYQSGVAVRNAAYDRGWMSSVNVGLPVISVGNIVAGGTGKTPFVKFLAEHLVKEYQVAILARGYHSRAEKSGTTLRISPDTDVMQCGDEPYWLARQLPQSQVWVGKNRVESALKARQAGADILIMDDGMQHRQLMRDFEIVLVDGEDPFGKGFFLPRGWLRDSPYRLKTADLIVVKGFLSEKNLEEVRHLTKAPIIFSETKSEISLQGKKVAVFCAIAKPSRFLKGVRDAEGEIVGTFFKPDHDVFTGQELKLFAERSCADIMACTEKDEVKLPKGFVCKLPVVALPSRLEITSNLAAWEEMLIKIKNRVKDDTRIPSHAS